MTHVDDLHGAVEDARFEHRKRARLCWLILEYVEDEKPDALLGDLAAVGWKSDGLAGLPPLNGVAEVRVVKRGSDLFGEWTVDEKRTYMREARAVLRKHGITRVPVYALGIEDLM